MTKHSPDVLIIGAGIAGLSIAYELAQTGVEVTVVDRRELYAGSSALNAGGMRCQFSHETNILCAIGSLERVTRFHDDFGLDVNFRQAGYVFVCSTAEQETTLRQAVELQNRMGVDTRIVQTDEISRIVPGLHTDDVCCASWGPGDGYVDPRALLQGFAAIGRRTGATILEHHPVTSITASGSRVTSVVAGDIEFTPAVVVNACGAWAPRIAQLYGSNLPITPRRSSLWVVGPKPDVSFDGLPQIIDIESRSFFHGDIDGTGALVFGIGAADLVEDTPDTPCNWDRFEDARRRMEHRFPLAAGAEIDRGWAGLIEATEDDNPIVGWTHFTNLYTAAGFSGHGMCVAPGLALSAAAEIRGSTPEISLDVFRLDRFDGGQFERESIYGATGNVNAENR